ncbi:MAG: hypothetical protein GY725_12655 [bacterium]|nr:hypothetical protein [bacterium]
MSVLALALLVSLSGRAGITATKHNLSTTGPGPIQAESEGRLCIFCHTPHHSSRSSSMLWNRQDSTETYLPYQSATLLATVDQPTGASKLCLSCHDGTVALGNLVSQPEEIGFVGGVRFMPSGGSLVDSDLRDDHPISFDYDSALAAQRADLVDPSELMGSVTVDPRGQLQCTSCHDPHNEGFGNFLVAPMIGSKLCLECHEKPDWAPSSHSTSLATWNGSGTDPWPHTDFTTLAENACQNCHSPHSAGSTAWILNHAQEEDNCLVCHDGTLAATDIQSDISAAFHHPVELTTDVHTPNEDPTFGLSEHVECSDCHEPHSTSEDAAHAAPLASPTLGRASGVDRNGSAVSPATYEYEVCFKCHGDSPMSDPPINRQLLEVNKRLQFDLSNASYHPVEGMGKNPNVPSLLSPYTETSLIYCSDCHASDRGPGAGGSGPAGPHGSVFEHILERQYNTIDGVPYDPSLYDLCFKCHSESSLRSDISFDKHKKHFEEEDAPCSACHDPHGVSDGTPSNNSHLINFDLSIVSADPNTGRLEFEDLGDNAGQCYLQCHGEDHSPESYGP